MQGALRSPEHTEDSEVTPCGRLDSDLLGGSAGEGRVDLAQAAATSSAP